MRKWEKKLLDGISQSLEYVEYDNKSKTLDVVLDETKHRYQIYRCKNSWSVCEMKGKKNGFGFRIVCDWDEFRTLEEAVEAILEDIQVKLALREDEGALAYRVFGSEATINEAVIEDEDEGQEILVEYRLKKVIYTGKTIWHIGIIVDAEYHDHIHDDENNEKIKQKYVGREIQISVGADAYWEIK